jgi:hypothetical protein
MQVVVGMMEFRHMFLANIKSAPEKLLLHKDPVHLLVFYTLQGMPPLSAHS